MAAALQRSMFQLLALAALASWASLAQAQMSCKAEAAAAPVRAEGRAELTADLILRCTGGFPAMDGTALPGFQILLSANAPLTSKDLPAATGRSFGWNETLLLVDEPAGGAQRPCVPAAGEVACQSVKGGPGLPNVIPSSRIQENAVVFSGVAIDPPGEGVRTLRFTNIRVDAANLDDQFFEDEVRLTPQIFQVVGGAIPVEPAEIVVARRTAAYSFSVRTAEREPVAGAEPGLTITPYAVPEKTPDPAKSFLVRFTEGFASAFRRRNLGTSVASPAVVVGQTLAGAAYHTESSFYNPAFGAASGIQQAGLADSGSRFKAVFEDIPENVELWVSLTDVRVSAVASPRARLTYTDAAGGGPFVPAVGSVDGFARLEVRDGAAVAIWEILGSDPNVTEDFDFQVLLTSSAGSPEPGAATVFGALAPTTGPGSLSTPRFDESVDRLEAFEVAAAASTQAFTVVSAASYEGPGIAPDSLVAGFGVDLAPAAIGAEAGLPTTLGGVTIEMIDAAGNAREPRLVLVSPTQINFWLEPEIPAGPAVLNVLRNGRLVASGQILIHPVAPALFSANGDGRGVAAAETLRVSPAASASDYPTRFDESLGRWVEKPISLGSSDELVFLVLYGTGLRGRSSMSKVSATVGGEFVPVVYAGAHSRYPGLDQVNLGPLPRSLAGKGVAEILLEVDAKKANRLTIAVE